ncbi:MAG: helix-hairpin-helix domain-containing protein, partial [Chloroflexota bacterium]
MRVCGPDINESAAGFSAAGDIIRFGLADVKGIGFAAAASIVAHRSTVPFRSVADVCRRVPDVSSGAVEALLQVGAFDSITEYPSRNSALLDMGRMLSASRSQAAADAVGQASLFGDDAVASLMPAPLSAVDTEDEKRAWERALLGIHLSDHPLLPFSALLADAGVATAASLTEDDAGRRLTVAGMVTDVQELRTKRGTLMGRVTLEDVTGPLTATLFAEAYEPARDWLSVGALALGQGRLDTSDHGIRLTLSSIEPLTAERIARPEGALSVSPATARLTIVVPEETTVYRLELALALLLDATSGEGMGQPFDLEFAGGQRIVGHQAAVTRWSERVRASLADALGVAVDALPVAA